MKTHRDLDVWRAAVSIASNIAEGAGRQAGKEFVRFLYGAFGSASELDTQLEISMMSGVGPGTDLERLQVETVRVSQMLHGLIRFVKARAVDA